MSNKLAGMLRGVQRDASEFRALVKLARKHKWDVSVTKNNHVKFLSPDGKTTVIAGMTAGSNAAMSKLRSNLRKAGLPV